jgi:hypothetical protein
MILGNKPISTVFCIREICLKPLKVNTKIYVFFNYSLIVIYDPRGHRSYNFKCGIAPVLIFRCIVRLLCDYQCIRWMYSVHIQFHPTCKVSYGSLLSANAAFANIFRQIQYNTWNFRLLLILFWPYVFRLVLKTSLGFVINRYYFRLLIVWNI